MTTKLSELVSNAQCYSGVSDAAAIRSAFESLDESPVTQTLTPQAIIEDESNLTYGEHLAVLVDELNSFYFHDQQGKTIDKRAYILRYFASNIEWKRAHPIWQRFLRCNYLSFIRLMPDDLLVSEKKIINQIRKVFEGLEYKEIPELTVADVLSVSLRKATRCWGPESETIETYQKSIRDAYYLIQIGVLIPMHQMHLQLVRESSLPELPFE